MKVRLNPCLFLLAVALVPRLHAQLGVVDLTALPNYAQQAKPAYITRDNTPANNPITNAGATLGRVMFYDKRLSRNDTVSCSSCHLQANAFGATAIASLGVGGTSARHPMRLANARFGQEVKFFWDQRAPTLEAQTSQPIQNHIEMGFSGTLGDPAFADLVTRLSAIPEYRVLFSAVYGGTTINETNVQLALAEFVRSIQSFDTKYDTGRAAVGNDTQAFPNFTASENSGKAIFLGPPGQNGGAGCVACHRPPEFDIDPNSLNNGTTLALDGTTDLTVTRAPSLRNLLAPGGVSNGGFMHNASLATLDQVVDHYNVIPADNANLDPRLRRPGGGLQNLNLSPQQHADLVNFLKTLTGTAVYTDARWSSPFTAAGTLTLIVLPPASMTIHDNGNGTVTLAARAAANLTYQLEASTDLTTWTSLGPVNSDATGNLAASATTADRAFSRFSFTPP